MSNIVPNQPAVCLPCYTRNYADVDYCRGCGYKIKSVPGPYRLKARITRKSPRG